LFNLPANAAFLLTGWSATTSRFGPLPLSLNALGMPGCTAFVSNDTVQLVLGSGGQATATFPIPNFASLVGLDFHQQAIVLDPLAGNALGAVMSDAATATIGTR
ncbi:MAG TPA: hypothetical protein VK348_08160, partial [Planctomycetota bacterium]|nr:hypothetical protein [Planctomycetota bacterium]